MEILNILLTVLVVAVIGLALNAKSGNKSRLSLSKKERIVGFWIIFGVALFLRLFFISAFPQGINQDGAMAAVDAKALADYGTDRFGTKLPAHLYAWGFGQMSSLLSYILAVFIKIFGLNVYTLRIPVALVSMAGFAAIYHIVKKLFDENTALLAAALLISNPWHFMQSRWALDCNMFPHFFAMGVMFLLWDIKRKRYLYISMIFFALCMYSYGVAFYMVPFFLVTVCIYLLVKKQIRIKDIAICVGIYFLISWPIYGTMLINFLKLETVELPFVTMSFFEDSMRSSDILFFAENKKEVFLSNLMATLRAVFYQSDDLIWNTVPGFGTIYRCMTPLMVIGGVNTFVTVRKGENENRRLSAFVVSAWWCFAVILGLIIRSVNVNRINIVFYANFLFLVAGLKLIIDKSRKLSFAVILTYCLMTVLFINTYFTTWSCNFWGDYIDALEYAEELKVDRYRFASCNSQYDAVMCSEILMMYVFEMDAEYFQGKTDSFKGVEMPYSERYRVGNLRANEPARLDTAYVVRTSDAEMFYDALFEKRVFGTYTVVYPKGSGTDD